tara:strand:- start:2167 stop:2598 length:432 start_codon:yes stop_codon:yes gene_type:complete
MNKFVKDKTNILKNIVKESNTYDGTNWVYDGSSNSILTEEDLRKKYENEMNDTQKYKLYKSTANNQEKKEFRDIERKYKKKSSIDQRTAPFIKKSDTSIPINLDFPKFISKPEKKDNTLKNIEKERAALDKDFFKGLGTFFKN